MPADDRLLISAAGQGSVWATVGLKIVAFAKSAPKAALVGISVIFKGGPERIVRASEAIVKAKESTARLKDAKADKAEADVVAAQALAKEAPMREAMTTEKQKFELQKQKADAFFAILERINKIEDPEQRAALSAAMNSNTQNLLGSVAEDWLQLPPSSSD